MENEKSEVFPKGTYGAKDFMLRTSIGLHSKPKGIFEGCVLERIK